MTHYCSVCHVGIDTNGKWLTMLIFETLGTNSVHLKLEKPIALNK